MRISTNIDSQQQKTHKNWKQFNDDEHHDTNEDNDNDDKNKNKNKNFIK